MKLKCDLIIQDLNNPIGGVLNQEKMHKGSFIGLYRPKIDTDNEHTTTTTGSDIILTVETKTSSFKYKLKRIETYTKFINEGKATLKLIDEKVYLLLSNCTSMTLNNFVSFLNAKLVKQSMTNGNMSRPIVKRQQQQQSSANEPKKFVNKLLNNAQCSLAQNSLANISPLCEKEMNDIMAFRRQKSQLSSGADSSPVTTQRSRPAFAQPSQEAKLSRSISQQVIRAPPQPVPLQRTNSSKTLTRQTSSTNNLLIQLTDDQKKVIQSVKSGKNLFFTGSGGTGKSFLIKVIRKCLPSEHCFVTASTGVAASLIDGVTLHSFAGLSADLLDKLAEAESDAEKSQTLLKQILAKICSSRDKLTNWKKCKHLIIDEISMVDAVLLETLDFIARSVKNNELPFGGIQLIVSGDFFQLPPVSRYGQVKKRFCFESRVWRETIQEVIELKQIKRQTDGTFIRLLEEIRYGRCSPKTIEILEKCKSRLTTGDILPTKLCTHKDDVEYINKSELNSLKSSDPATRDYPYTAIDTGDTKTLNQLCPAGEKLTLKKNCQVMLLKNLDVAGNLVNGSRGCIVGFSEPTKLPIVKFLNGAEMVIKYDTWSFRQNGGLGGASSVLERKQLPLQLAWAISIHKSQGMTLDSVEISLSRVFECGQAYVALSRAKSLSSIRIVDFDPSAIRANQTVVKFYERIKRANNDD
jgi:ATP-dependent DNA helicase PIF1